MAERRFVDVADTETFALVPPCADPRFDHRTCDYWEDADRGAKDARPGWLRPVESRPRPVIPALEDNPFAPVERRETWNPFADPRDSGLDDPLAVPADNPFAPRSTVERPVTSGVPRKLALLDRGRGVFGSYAKLCLTGDHPVAYSQFGPLSAYPRAGRLRELYSQLPDSPLPAVITCIAATAEAHGEGHATALIEEVCRDLAERGFSAVEAYPDLTRPELETSAARPAFWHGAGFATAVDDERFPVMRRELR